MADSTKLNKDGLNKVWLKVMELIQSLTGNVDRTKGTLQEQIDKVNGNLADNYPLKTQISNPNLVDNPWFTVNQRGQSNYTELGYALDRWVVNNFSTAIELQENGIIVSNKNDGTINLTQWLSDDLTKDLFGKEITLSIKLIDGTILSTSFSIPEIISDIIYGYIHIKNEIYLAITGNTEANKNAVFLYTGTADSDSISIQAIKLELGSISTLAMDTAPNYALELAKCSMSTADSNDTYANKPNYAELCGNLSHENLLDNPWFTVNQRGQSEYDKKNYGVDRWKTQYGKVVVNADGSISVINEYTGTIFFSQLISESDAKLLMKKGKTMTLSIKFSDNSIISFSGSIPTLITNDGDGRAFIGKISDGVYVDFFYRKSIDMWVVQFNIDVGKSMNNIRAVKLESGSISTLAMDTTPNYALELIKCSMSTADSADTYANKTLTFS